MRTRNSDAPKSTAAKKTPPSRRSAAKSAPAEADSQPATPKMTKRVAAMRAKQLKSSQTTPSMDIKLEEQSGEGVEVSQPPPKFVGAKKSLARRIPLWNDTCASGQGVSLPKAESEKVDELNEEAGVSEAENTEESVEEEEDDATRAQELVAENEQCSVTELEVVANTETKEVNEKEELRNGGGPSKSVERVDEETKKEDTGLGKVVDVVEGAECEEKVYLGEHGDEELLENVDADDRAENTKALQEEERELRAIVRERKDRKEREVFVGGLDRDATEEEVRRIFEKMGEIVGIRLHMSPSTNKNRGYAFVEYAKKEYTKRALAEMKNPVIHGKRCGTAPSEDNDTLFLGNICNTWTKEAIRQKLKDYGVEGIENITLVPDLQREWLSRGFAFVEFTCHAEAMFAYKRLQKPDVIFGHPERTAKVAFAEPLREPDPGVMAQIKSVFIDGFPPHWDEEQVREQLKGYGEITRICLSRNMSTAKRKDFGFVDFATHEAAIACIDGINNMQLHGGSSKMKLKARLLNPLPKTQAVKGGMCGGFRIGRKDEGFPRFGRGSDRGRHSFNNSGFPRDRGFYRGGRGRMGPASFPNEYGFDNPYMNFHERQMSGQGGRRGSFRGGRYAAGGVARPNRGRQWFGASDQEQGMHYPPRRQPHSPELHFDGPFPGNHFDDPYFYGGGMHGMKRPSYMRDPDPDFVEPSRIRPRLDYTDPAAPFHENRYQDAYGAGSSLPPRDFYRPDYAGGPYSSFYGGDHHPPYGRGYYF